MRSGAQGARVLLACRRARRGLGEVESELNRFSCDDLMCGWTARSLRGHDGGRQWRGEECCGSVVRVRLGLFRYIQAINPRHTSKLRSDPERTFEAEVANDGAR